MKNWNPVLPHPSKFNQLCDNAFIKKHFGLTDDEFEYFRSKFLKELPPNQIFLKWLIKEMREKMHQQPTTINQQPL